MSLRTRPLLLTLLLANLLTSENFTKSGIRVVTTTIQNAKNVCISGLKEKLSQHDFQLNSLNKQLEKLNSDFKSLSEKQLEHKIFAPQDCKEILRRGYKSSGMYRVKPLDAKEKFWVWCDMTTRGGGWTYVLNRFDGSVNFYRNWTDYKEGFGKLSGEFWMGLENLHILTSSKMNELRFELMDWNITEVFAGYDIFVVGSEKAGYNVQILGKFSGTAGDSFGDHAKMNFSTPDRDTVNHCAKSFRAGWWYSDCFYCLLTGEWVDHGPLTSKDLRDKIFWGHFRGMTYNLKQARMMIRPID